MEKEPRKASEVLLELEKKLDVALSIIRAQDLNIKILSNKLNSVLDAINKGATAPSKITVEAVNTVRAPAIPVSPFQQGLELDPEKQLPVSADFNLPLETAPTGFRRTSRPETFEGDNSYLPQGPKFPTQIPKAPPGRNPNAPPPGRGPAEVVVPPAATKRTEPPSPKQQLPQQSIVQNAIPVSQRVVNGHGRSLFMADVEIIDLTSMQSIAKTRTQGTGKWMASLGIGNYRIIIRKFEAATKEKLEVSQDIQVDGTQSPLELPAIIVKSS